MATHKLTITFPQPLETEGGTVLGQYYNAVISIDGTPVQVPLHAGAAGTMSAILEVQGPIQTPDGAPDAPMVPLAEYHVARARRIARRKGLPDAQ